MVTAYPTDQRLDPPMVSGEFSPAVRHGVFLGPQNDTRNLRGFRIFGVFFSSLQIEASTAAAQQVNSGRSAIQAGILIHQRSQGRNCHHSLYFPEHGKCRGRSPACQLNTGHGMTGAPHKTFGQVLCTSPVGTPSSAQ